MKTFNKFLSVFLSILMFALCLPQSVYAQMGESLTTEAEADAVDSMLEEDERGITALFEDTSLRTENAKYIRMSDGSYYIAVYDDAVHYLDDNDVWQEIDNTLNDSEAADESDFAGVAAKNGARWIKFANNSNANGLVTISNGSQKLRISLVGANKSKAAYVQNPEDHSGDAEELTKITDVKKTASRVLYADILDGVDLEYVAIGNSVKENIIVKEKKDSYSYSFDLKLNKLIAEQDKSGRIYIRDEIDDSLVYVIPLPYMIDANGTVSNEVSYVLSKTNNKEYRITVTANASWINEEGRSFPVVIDPPLDASSASTVDTYIYEGNPYASYGSGNISFVGFNSGNEYRHYWKLPVLPTIPQDSIVTSAKVSFYLSQVALNPETASVPVCAYEVTSPWDTNMTWRTRASVDDNIVDYQMVKAENKDKHVEWDITRIAKKWYQSADNNGIAFHVFMDDSSSVSSASFGFVRSSSTGTQNTQPVFTVKCRSTVGVEDYFTYHTQMIGRAGEGYIQDYSSQLTLVRNDITAGSTAMPFSLNHVYNDAYAGRFFTTASDNQTSVQYGNFSSMPMGYGWKLNVQETVVAKTISGQTYYVYTDSDGTEHYFKNGTDEDGLGLKLSGYQYNFTITDKSETRKEFIYGILSKIIDSNGNTIRMVYNSSDGLPRSSGNRLVRIDRYLYGYLTENTAETLASFSYDSQGRLSAISDLVGRRTRFTYTNNQLTGVTYPDGATVHYEYADNILISAYDEEANYGVEYTKTLTDGTIERTIKEYYLDSEERVYGKTLLAENDVGVKARYTDLGDDGEINTADDVVTTYCFDTDGRTVGAYSTDSTYEKTYGASAVTFTSPDEPKQKRNKISSFGAVGLIPQNLLHNGGAEVATNWTGFGGNATRSTYRKHTGNYSLSLESQAFTSGEVGFSQESPSLSANTVYTVSAYVDVSRITSTSNGGGVYLKAAKGNDVYISEKLSADLNSTLDDKWQRIYLTFTPESSGSYTISVCLDEAVGTAYFDDIQLEKNSVPSIYNYIGAYCTWQLTDNSEMSTYADEIGESRAIRFTGVPNSDVNASVTVPINRKATTSFMVSAWATGWSIPQTEDKKFAILAKIVFTDGTDETVEVPFHSGVYGVRQYITGIVKPDESNITKTIQDIELTVSYKNNSNNAYVYDIALVEQAVETYSYDNKGNMATATRTNISTVHSFYDDQNKLTSSSQKDQQYEYTYMLTDNTRLLYSIKNDGLTIQFNYDSAGSVVSTMISSDDSEVFLQSDTYSSSANGNMPYLSENINGLGIVYEYDNRNLCISSTTECNQPIEYSYHANNDRLTSTHIDDLISVNYSYLKGSLSEIVRSGYIEGNNTEQNQTYSFTYDGFGNVTAVLVGNTQLVSYTYEPRNGRLLRTTYGNGAYIDNIYDELGRVVEVRVNGNSKYIYSYDGDGLLYQAEDVDNGTFFCYTYDSQGRLLSTRRKMDGTVHGLTSYAYDDQNRVSGYYCGLSGVVGGKLGQTYHYSYDENDGSLSSITVDGDNISGDTLEYTYDALKRLSGKKIQSTNCTLVAEYGYYDLVLERSTMLISDVTWKLQGTTELTYSYQYDGLKNIVGISKNGNSDAAYTYDEQSQLLTETRYADNVCVTYTYDTYGNIRSAVTRNLSTNAVVSTETYGYNDTNWLDKLTSYNGTPITYDNISNPLSYYNGSAYAFTWESGRKLSGVSHNGNTISYVYGEDGQRIEKTVGSTVYKYYYADGQLIRQTWGNNYIDFLYDEAGVYSIVYNGTQYYFVKNLQGDVTQIRNSQGAVVVEYSYDAWGKVLSVTGTMANTLGVINPIRYRGYYFDIETGFYYLQSRYYDPAIRRFINADDTDYIGAGSEFIGQNLFVYCGNSPLLNVDYDGHLSWKAKVAIGLGVIAVAAVLTVATAGTGTALACFAVGALKGAVTGAAVGAVTGAAGGAASHIITTGSTDGIGQAMLEGAADGFMSGAITGFVAGGVTSSQCFVAGTSIATAEGLVAIENIQLGDKVWATNPETGKTELKSVKQLFRNETNELIHVTLNGEKIVCTKEHPFYSPVKGWTEACELRAGDRLQSLNGGFVIVEQVQHEILEAPVATYNFEVEDFHTYYVGDTNVLVHNTCRGVGNKGWEGDSVWRENVKTVGNGGTIETLNGGIPSQIQAEKLITQSGGTLVRSQLAHQPPNPHMYSHINYLTQRGVKGTIQVLEKGFKVIKYLT